jgi:hypothetical protein
VFVDYFHSVGQVFAVEVLVEGVDGLEFGAVDGDEFCSVKV